MNPREKAGEIRVFYDVVEGEVRVHAILFKPMVEEWLKEVGEPRIKCHTPIKTSGDAIRLIAKVKDLDVEATRDLVRKFLGPGLLGRLEECLRRAGHPRARRAYSLGS